MAFQKGNRLGPGGKKGNKGGRPTKIQQEIKQVAAEIARQFIDDHVQDFLESYLALGKGTVIERLDKKGKKVRLIMLDPATVRHAIDKFVPPIEKREHSGEVGVRPWMADVDPRLLKKKKKLLE
jgi:hypothetical protein